MTHIANSWWEQGLPKGAEPVTVPILNFWRRMLGTAHPSTADAMQWVAVIWTAIDRHADAVPVLSEVLDFHESHYGASDHRTLLSMRNLGSVWYTVGHYDKAYALTKKSVDLARKALGPDHSDVTGTLRDLKHFKEARDLKHFKEARDGAAFITIYEREALAAKWFKAERHVKAAVAQKKVFTSYKALFGRHNEYTILSMRNLACIWNSLGRNGGAETLTREATKLQEETPASENVWSISLKNFLVLNKSEEPLEPIYAEENLALNLANAGRKAEAESVLLQVYEFFKEHLGSSFHHTIFAARNLAYLWDRLGRHDEAESFMTEAVISAEKTFGFEHEYYIQSRNFWSDTKEHGRLTSKTPMSIKYFEVERSDLLMMNSGGPPLDDLVEGERCESDGGEWL